MFSTLESSWDHSARRGWSAIASFTFQAMALSLLVAIPMFWVQGPPSLHWFTALPLPSMQMPQPPAPTPREHNTGGTVSNLLNDHVIAPTRIPTSTPQIDDSVLGPPAPDLSNFRAGRGVPDGVPYGPGTAVPTLAPKPAATTHPLKISHWAEGNLIYRVQPTYPPLARQARIQGAVQLRAIISKAGTIEHLTLESGHPMLAGAAMDAVRQWRYRPYLLNDEPIEIETEITVNFLLSGN
jgi:protein TonB